LSTHDPTGKLLQDAQLLEQVIRTSRQRCGGTYARWQELLDRKDSVGLAAFANSPEGLSFRSMLVAALGRDLKQAKQFDACRAFLRAAVDRYPHDVFLHHDLYINCVTASPPDYAEALSQISASSVLRPECALFHYQSGCTYIQLKAPDNAVVSFRKALALRPDYFLASMAMAGILETKKDFEGALSVYRAAINASPDDAELRLNFAKILDRQGRTQEAASAFEDALPLARKKLARFESRVSGKREELVEPLCELAETLIKVGRSDEAAPMLEEVVRLGAGKKNYAYAVQSTVAAQLKVLSERRDLAGCRRLAESWEKAGSVDPAYLYNAACWRAVTAAVARTSSSPDATKQSNAEADLAVNWLKDAVARGYNNIKHMKKDADLAVLRNRDDFKKLIADLEAEKP